MDLAATLPVYLFVFFSLYVQVFLLLTFFEKRREIGDGQATEPARYPSATIIVPCWNEENTVIGTMESLFALEYPKDKLNIFIVDDGSTDRTWEVIQRFRDLPNVTLFKKENGGKHTALNHALAHVTTELVGCLDADSFVEPDTLKKIAFHFEDPSVMAVTPAIKLENPRNLLELIQNVEYSFGIFFRKIMAMLDAIQVAPGPFSIFRKKVFDDLGPYRAAHNTEDLEIAFRMQESRYRIANSHKAFVRTVPPKTLRGLYRQRLRWTYGFLKNAFDYRHLFFRKEYGNFGVFTLPAAAFSVFSILYLVSFSLFQFGSYVSDLILRVRTVGIADANISFDWFFVNTGFLPLLGIVFFASALSMILLGKWMAEDLKRPPFDIAYFMLLYGFIAPSWLFMAVYNAVRSRGTSWR